ncbi:cellulase family glycosylhydrolase [Flavobacterium qiangtangense]|uniref:Cellulase family glycosylhydrolase n=1 Tax=Flavobacterium qiangtangense TaxID=1442595 RepID=A0ABW1PK30_9FLAO
MKKVITSLFAICSISMFGQDFLHQDGQKIVDGSGNNIILRGLGVGGWMVQEGYMLKTDGFAGTQFTIKNKIEELIGKKDTEEFYKAYLKNGITKRDIDSLKAWGFNSVRLPMHYNLYTLPIEKESVSGENTWLDEGFKMTDDLLKWCEANEMYLILDLHAAPGGQGMDANISDYDTTKPSLWESEANKKKMVAFWVKLAKRYKDKKWIGGYDIINEPNWNFSGTNKNGCDEKLNAPLRALQLEITKAIRTVDKNHLVIIEGNCWGNNYNGIFPLWDKNMALSFHKYWNYNDQASIQDIVNLREEHNVPIWMGEGGENSNVWFKESISLLEKNNIGWAFWPMKKVENIAGVTSVTMNSEYQKLLEYWKNGGEKPTPAFAKKALMQLAENYKIENVTVKPDVIDAMFRQVQTDETKPYKNNILPGIIHAVHYDLGTNGFAYKDNDVVNYKTVTGKFDAWNKGDKMRNDGVDIEKCSDKQSIGFSIGFIETGEWLQYTVNTNSTNFNVDIRYSNAGETGKMTIEDETGNVLGTIELPKTGGKDIWKTITAKNIVLKKGTNKLRMKFEKGGFNLNYFEFKKAK